MNNYRINKGLQKEIRFLGLNYHYAMLFLGAVTLTWLFLFSLIGITLLKLFLYLVPVFGYHQYFKVLDKKNQKFNIKKRKANSTKPTQFKRHFTSVTENNEELLTK